VRHHTATAHSGAHPGRGPADSGLVSDGTADRDPCRQQEPAGQNRERQASAHTTPRVGSSRRPSGSCDQVRSVCPLGLALNGHGQHTWPGLAS
jgi:hypothetical protein